MLSNQVSSTDFLAFFVGRPLNTHLDISGFWWNGCHELLYISMGLFFVAQKGKAVVVSVCCSLLFDPVSWVKMVETFSHFTAVAKITKFHTELVVMRSALNNIPRSMSKMKIVLRCPVLQSIKFYERIE